MPMTTEQIHAKVLRLFSYAADKETFGYTDYWSSFATHVEAGQPFTGDCDNFAMTCAELAVRNGYAPSKVLLALCWTEEDVYHAVCIVGNRLLDNRYSRPFDWRRAPYRWDRAMRLSEPGVWRDMSDSNNQEAT